MTDYTALPQLSAFFLEDSFVLDITARPGLVSIELDLVLTPAHPEHSGPKPGEQHCYRRGRIEFSGVRRLLWANQGARPAIDASGELDFGGIDSLTHDDLGYTLEGEWGRIDLQADDVNVTFLPDDTP